MVELLGHAELVVDGQREPLLLGPVAERGVEDVDGIGQPGRSKSWPAEPVGAAPAAGLPAVGVGPLTRGRGWEWRAVPFPWVWP